MLWVSSGPEMQLSHLQGTGKFPHKKIISLKISVVPKLRNPTLEPLDQNLWERGLEMYILTSLPAAQTHLQIWKPLQIQKPLLGMWTRALLLQILVTSLISHAHDDKLIKLIKYYLAIHTIYKSYSNVDFKLDVYVHLNTSLPHYIIFNQLSAYSGCPLPDEKTIANLWFGKATFCLLQST